MVQALASSWEDEATEEVVLQLRNLCDAEVKALWIDYKGSEVLYAEVGPGEVWSQDTYSTHPWVLRWADDDSEVTRYVGGSVLLEVQADRSVRKLPKEPVLLPEGYIHPIWGPYLERKQVLRISIMAYTCVCDEAVDVAGYLLTRMLEHTPGWILQRLHQAGARIAIIGRDQVTTDIPDHAFMRSRRSRSDRDLDETARGLGGTPAVPTCSCGEENLLRTEDEGYSQENILLHEFGHSVMEIGLTQSERSEIEQLYEEAKGASRYHPDCYMMENSAEYWAEACQTWFDATLRTDVNSGINSREKLRRHDPGLARLLERVFGDGAWRYWHDCPGKWGDTVKVSSPAPVLPHVAVMDRSEVPGATARGAPGSAVQLGCSSGAGWLGSVYMQLVGCCFASQFVRHTAVSSGVKRL